MVMNKAFSNAVILTLLVVLPFVQSSSSSGIIFRTSMTTSRPLVATNTEVAMLGDEGVSVGVVEDSARKVPTGPDPLHHNNYPLGP